MKKYKTCKNIKCGKKFYRGSKELPHHWKRRIYCKRSCGVIAQSVRVGKNRDTAFSYTTLQDSAVALLEKTRANMAKSVVTYSSKTMSQEELKKLVPSLAKER